MSSVFLQGNNAQNNRNSYNFSEETQRLYEQQNNKEIDSLGNKVNSLKHIALDIGKEVDQHNNLLDGMDSQMGSVGQLMGSALDKIGEMMQAGGSKHMCYLILLIVCLFLFLYFLLMWK